ncbi:MAG: DNRLRE domain-containing protein, partial [Nanoarchaeota archaeon]|nr:DNRLRE domain-containing protein [Nanoarchaeota archaeon]
MKAKKQVKGWRKEVDTFFSRWHAFISKHIHPNAVPVMVFAVVIFSFLFMFMLKQAGIIGMVISPAGLNYSDEINMNFSRTQEYIWYPDNIGDINSISLDGNIIGNGSVRISMIIGDETYLVLDSTLLEAQSGGLITGFVTGIETGVETGNITLDELSEEEFADIESEIEQQETNVTEEESEPAAPPLPIPPENADIQINLEYLNDSNFDTDNDGIEVYDGVIDLSISDTAFNWAVDESHLCTKWIITNHDIIEETAFCYGDAQCCDLIEVDLLGEIWDDDYYSFKGKDGAGENNTISAQVIYVDYNLSSENLYSYIYYSNNAEKQLIFLPTSSQMISFNNGCIDTCILSSINETNYRFIIETGPGTTFELHKINYYFAGSAMNLTGLQPDDLINTSYTLLCNDGELGMKDTYLRLRYPDVNYGDYDSVKVGNENALDWYRRGLFQFNLSYIQSNAVITSAELKIYKKTGAPDPNITLYRMIQSWDEDEATW